MDLHTIKEKIKNRGCVSFYIKDYDYGSFLEDLLLSGYKWNGNLTNTKISDLKEYKNYTIIINLGSFPKNSILYNRSGDNNIGDFVNTTKLTKYQLKSLFIDTPSYKPKKIERTI